jgi:hypothetical protein
VRIQKKRINNVSGRKKVLVVLLCLAIMASVGLGLIWHKQHYVIVDFLLYPRDAQTLDLLGQAISVSHYNKLRRNLPDCEIFWDVPVRGKLYSQDTKALEIPDMTPEDVQILAFFPLLETLDANGCTDYSLLQTIQRTYPELQVLYTVTIGGRDYAQDEQVLRVDGLKAEELDLLAYLPELAQVRLETGKDPEQVEALMAICHQRDIPVQVVIGGKSYDSEITSLSLKEATVEELSMLQFFRQLKRLDLEEPQADAAHVRQLEQRFPGAQITVTKTLFGIALDAQMEKLDLTNVLSKEGAAAYERAKTLPVQGDREETIYMFGVLEQYPLGNQVASTDRLITQVEQALSYFPNIREVLMCGVLLDNEAMAAFRENHRQDYKVIWSVQCGNKIIVRTDTPYFMPTKHHVYYFLDADSENLKYCEDIIALDLGHMAIKNIDWVKYMPNLTYLVLAHTEIQYIEPIRECKNLKFLELDWSPIRDYSPLLDLTTLEDLNLGRTYADFAPVEKMTWLKNLWIIDCAQGPRYRVPTALPNTRVMTGGDATVAGGWRELPNYYAMRDMLRMYYMKW